MGSSEARALNQIITETKLFHFHRIFKNGGGGGGGGAGRWVQEKPGPLQVDSKVAVTRKSITCYYMLYKGVAICYFNLLVIS